VVFGVREEDHRDARLGAAEVREEVEPVAVGQFAIEDDAVELLVQPAARRADRVGIDDLSALHLEAQTNQSASGRVIIDDQDDRGRRGGGRFRNGLGSSLGVSIPTGEFEGIARYPAPSAFGPTILHAATEVYPC
jgi:hypothetical protein